METVGIAAAKYATMMTRPMRVRPGASPATGSVAAGSGPQLNPTRFIPGPNAQMGRVPQSMPHGLQPTPFMPPTAEAQFSAASQAAPIGHAAQVGHQAGFHFDPFSGGEFKVRRASLETLFACSLGVKAAQYALGGPS